MLESVAAELRRIVESTTDRFRHLSPEEARARIDPAKWSIQEILGHLIDSAANNHQRFVRALKADSLVFPKYEQDHWVQAQAYNELVWSELVELWRLYNRHLAGIIGRIPASRLAVECRIGEYPSVSLKFLTEDYIDHLKHHLGQIDRLWPDT